MNVEKTGDDDENTQHSYLNLSDYDCYSQPYSNSLISMCNGISSHNMLDLTLETLKEEEVKRKDFLLKIRSLLQKACQAIPKKKSSTHNLKGPIPSVMGCVNSNGCNELSLNEFGSILKTSKEQEFVNGISEDDYDDWGYEEEIIKGQREAASIIERLIPIERRQEREKEERIRKMELQLHEAVDGIKSIFSNLKVIRDLKCVVEKDAEVSKKKDLKSSLDILNTEIYSSIPGGFIDINVETNLQITGSLLETIEILSSGSQDLNCVQNNIFGSTSGFMSLSRPSSVNSHAVSRSRRPVSAGAFETAADHSYTTPSISCSSSQPWRATSSVDKGSGDIGGALNGLLRATDSSTGSESLHLRGVAHHAGGGWNGK